MSMISEKKLFEFRSAIYRQEYEYAADITNSSKDGFDASQIFENARKYHYGLDGAPVNFLVAVGLYEWAHNGQWFEDTDKCWAMAPKNSQILVKAKAVSSTSFLEWSDAAEKNEEYESNFIGFDDYNYYSDSIIIAAAMKGYPEALGPAINLYKKILGKRSLEIIAEDDLWFWSDADSFFYEIERVNGVKFTE